MVNYTSLGADVEVEYDAFCAEPTRDLTVFYEKLFVYLKYMTRKFMNENRYVDEMEIEDIANEVMAYVATEVLHTYKKEKAMFATYCAQIVKHKVWNWKKKRIRICLDTEGEFEESMERMEGGRDEESPECKLLTCESRIEMIALVKKYIKALMEWKQKPYRTVGCGFTMLLFQKHHPNTKELTSPKWAFEMLSPKTVEAGAEQFLEEMREWMPNVPLMWNADFLDAMDEMEDGVLVSDIVFGERFKTKDFENWSLRLREKLKRQLLENEMEFCL